MPKPYTHDSKCEELAEHFLAERPELMPLSKELAQEIQDAVEDWFLNHEIKAKE